MFRQELEKSLGMYALVLTIVGTLTGLVSIRICYRLRKTVTFVFLTFLSATNIVSLYYWNLNVFCLHHTTFTIPQLNLKVCRIGTFVQLSTLQLSAWFLVACSVEQYLSVKINHWRTVHFKMQQAVRVSILLIIIILLLNSHMLLTYGVERQEGNQSVTYCYSRSDIPETEMTHIWNIAHLGLYSLGPFLLLVIFNSLLIRETLSRSSATAQQLNQLVVAPLCAQRVSATRRYRFTALNRTVILITVLFFLMTLPCAGITFFYDRLLNWQYGTLVITFFGELSFSYHGFTLVIIYFSNSRFRKELLNEFRVLIEF
nr:G protein-coupled receptor [Proales similis]